MKASDYKPHELRYQLIRLYIGLENPKYLIKDIEQALTFKSF